MPRSRKSCWRATMRIADLGDGLLALLDILDELDGALVALFDVVARALFVGAVARDQLLVGGIQAKLRQVFVVHDDQPLVAVLDEGDIGLDQPRLNLVVAQTGARIEGANVVERRLHGFDGTADGLCDFFVLLVLQAAQVLVDDGHGVLKNLRGAVSVLLLRELRLMKAKLRQQAFAQIAASYARRIELLDDLQRFLQIRSGEARLVNGCGTRLRLRRGSNSSSCRFLSSRAAKPPNAGSRLIVAATRRSASRSALRALGTSDAARR